MSVASLNLMLIRVINLFIIFVKILLMLGAIYWVSRRTASTVSKSLLWLP